MEEQVRKTVGGKSRVSVLLIDDEQALLRSMARFLSKTYSVTTAHGGSEALELLELRSDFDVIFCDVMMPGVDGSMIYEWAIENRPELASRFVFCTGGAFTDKARAFLDSVATQCAQKPLGPARLQTLIASVIERSNAG